ncbi:MAG: CDP-alcohol phosphatidyltransferase family protein [Candidatus Moraniibacteriota bacterium]|nr:MAG: CDP-alcohol phosphatidyltransferase family protein [Candidatus Moranbacteria bacterium]
MLSFSSLFAIDETKARADGLKMPLVNIVDELLLMPLIRWQAAQIYQHFDNYFVPDTLTLCSILVRLTGLACLFYDAEPQFLPGVGRRAKRLIAGASFMVGYYFDCFDGYYARKYNKCTMFGCWLDHLNDITMCGAYFVLALRKKMWLSAALMAIMLVFVVNQVLLEEEAFGNHTEFFNLVTRLAAPFRLFRTSAFMRYFGTSSWFLVVACALALE